MIPYTTNQPDSRNRNMGIHCTSLSYGRGLDGTNFAIMYKMGSIVRTTLLFCLIFLGPTNLSAQDFLPKVLPEEFQHEKAQQYLQDWIEQGYEPPENHPLRFDQIKIRNQSWLRVQFKLNVHIDLTMSLKERESVLNDIGFGLRKLKQAGAQVRVLFCPFVFENKKFVSKMKDSVPMDHCWAVAPMQQTSFDISFFHEKHPFWLKENFTQGVPPIGRSFARPLMKEAFVAHHANGDSAFLHELQHLLLLSADAYDDKSNEKSEEKEKFLSRLNAYHCEARAHDGSIVHPIEVYIGLKRYGQTVPGWESYIRSRRIFSIHQRKIMIHNDPLDPYEKDINMEIHSSLGKKLKSIHWEFHLANGRMSPKVFVRDHRDSKKDLSLSESELKEGQVLEDIPSGVYLIYARLNRNGDPKLLNDEWYQTFQKIVLP